jgi:serine/threonine-protein kinase RsbW
MEAAAVSLAGILGRSADAPFLELTLPARRESLALMRATVEPFLLEQIPTAADVSLDEILLAVQEAGTNIVRHAYPNWSEPGPLRMALEVSPHLLRIAMVDEGPGYDPQEIPPPDFSHPGEGGFGLHLMRVTMSKVTYQRNPGHNVLLLEKTLLPAEGVA